MPSAYLEVYCYDFSLLQEHPDFGREVILSLLPTLRKLDGSEFCGDIRKQQPTLIVHSGPDVVGPVQFGGSGGIWSCLLDTPQEQSCQEEEERVVKPKSWPN